MPTIPRLTQSERRALRLIPRPTKRPGPHPPLGASVRLVSVADLPSRFGLFRAVGFTPDRDGKEHLAIVKGDVRGRSDVPTRVHSECLTGDVMGSLRCDCNEQLRLALEAIGRMPRGVLLYLRQEGRGIGLTNKIRAYALQDRGVDTIEANRMLGFGDDQRDYAVAAQMLDALGVRSVRLMTNNPAKLTGLRAQGVEIKGRLPLVTSPNPHNVGYLATKQSRAGHWLGIEIARPAPAQSLLAPAQPRPAREDAPPAKERAARP